jgi:hypothetical protein
MLSQLLQDIFGQHNAGGHKRSGQCATSYLIQATSAPGATRLPDKASWLTGGILLEES